jgi:hypothetical protein
LPISPRKAIIDGLEIIKNRRDHGVEAGTGMPGDNRGLGVNTLGEQDTGTIEQRLPGNAELPAAQAGFELAAQSFTTAAISEMQDEADWDRGQSGAGFW